MQTQRVCLRLDRGLVLERLIGSHMETLTVKRTQDWLRSLLAQGFLLESRLLHQASTSTGEEITTGQTGGRGAMAESTFARWLVHEGERRTTRVRPMAANRRMGPPPVAAGPSKPFAHLRKVLG